MEWMFIDALAGQWPLSAVQIKRNELGQVEGIKVSNGRVRNLWFQKEKVE